MRQAASLNRRRLVLSALLGMLGSSLFAQVSFEAMAADYRNLRGINFVPVYPSLDGTTNYYGVASATAMWRFYDTAGTHPTAADVDMQLDWAKKCGFNAVRVFLSFPAWLHYRPSGGTGPNAHVTRYADFLGRCQAKGIYVMPVLWDSIVVHPNQSLEPDYQDPIALNPGLPNNISYWHSNPGPTRMALIQQQTSSSVPFANTDAGRYVRDFIDASRPFAQTVLMWDAMNEPVLDALHQWWVHETMATIRQYAPQQPPTCQTTTWSLWVTDQSGPSMALANDMSCDVLSIHPYGNTRATLETMLYDATYVNGAGQWLRKPVICTEIGYPGIASSYRDTVRYCAGVPRPELGADERGIGFMPWTLMVTKPFPVGTGMFYADLNSSSAIGVVREPDAVMAFVEHAVHQGVSSSQLWQPAQLVQISPNAPVYVDPRGGDYVGPAWDDYATLELLLKLPAWVWQLPGFWTWDAPGSTPMASPSFRDVTKLMRKVCEGLDRPALICSRNNGNPTALRLPGSGHEMPTDSLIGSYWEAFNPMDPNLQSFFGMIDRLETQLLPATSHGWLRPWDSTNSQYQSWCVSIVMQYYVQPFAQELARYVLPRGGPY